MTCHVWQTQRKTLTRHKKLSVKHIQIQNDINSAPHLQVSWEHVMSKTTNIPSIYSPVWLSLCVDCLPATGLLTLTGSLFHRGISWARAAPVTVLSLLGWARGGCRRLTAGESCQYSLMLQSLHLLNSSCRSSRGSLLQTSCGVTGTSSLGRSTHQTDIVGSCCCWWPRRSAPPSHRKLASEPRRRPGRCRGAERVWPQEICRVSHHHRALYTEQRSAGSKWICGLKRGLTPRHLFSV